MKKINLNIYKFKHNYKKKYNKKIQQKTRNNNYKILFQIMKSK